MFRRGVADSPRVGALSGRHTFALFALAGLIGMLAIGGGSLLASERSGESEAMAAVRALTEATARTVVAPNLSAALLEGDPAAIERLDSVMMAGVIDDSTVRVKLWDSTGRIVYSDKIELIGETYALEEKELESLRSGQAVAELTTLGGPENRFENEHDELLEVYLPIDGPNGETLLYESYFVTSRVSAASSRIRAEFVPIIIAALVLMEALHLGLAWGLSRRLERLRLDRERLLRGAIASSGIERRRIAGELHDGVVQDLVATNFTLAAAAESARVHSHELAADLHAAAVGTQSSLQSLRSLLVDIYPPNLFDRGLESALHDVLAPAARLGIRADLSVQGDIDQSPESAALVYRVVQESVRNVFRHSGASTLEVNVKQHPSATIALISDNGDGFRPDDATDEDHFGLRLLTDLTRDAGANLLIDSSPGVGTDIRLVVPA